MNYKLRWCQNLFDYWEIMSLISWNEDKHFTRSFGEESLVLWDSRSGKIIRGCASIFRHSRKFDLFKGIIHDRDRPYTASKANWGSHRPRVTQWVCVTNNLLHSRYLRVTGWFKFCVELFHKVLFCGQMILLIACLPGKIMNKKRKLNKQLHKEF